MSLFLQFLAAIPPYAMFILYICVPMGIGLAVVYVFGGMCRMMDAPDVQPEDVHAPHSVLREY